MTLRVILSRLRLTPLIHDGHHLRRSLSAAAAKLPDELPPGAPAPTSDSRLFVAGLSWSVDERSLTDAFSSFGTVTEDGAQCRSSAKCRGGREPLHRPQACSLFDEIPVRDVVTCSAAIYRHARSGLFHESAELFVGMMRAVRIMYDKNSGRSRGFGFVHFSNDNEAKCAKDAMDGKHGPVLILQVMLGRPLRISFALGRVRGASVIVPRLSTQVK
ncbi:RNA-binding protein CP31B, chloroplastic isoform X1 [Zea mays]|uniref:RRM domain-containing protein n=1 Tax=Zea mays TaxID=4577 RepID=A0A804QWP3_MAIZE|nr:RNA-binding protein CP31B, chloroplastic-like isoform X1 [Zea mays]